MDGQLWLAYAELASVSARLEEPTQAGRSTSVPATTLDLADLDESSNGA